MFLGNFIILLKTHFLNLIVYYHILLMYVFLSLFIIYGLTNKFKGSLIQVKWSVLVTIFIISFFYWNPNIVFQLSIFYNLVYSLFYVVRPVIYFLYVGSDFFKFNGFDTRQYTRRFDPEIKPDPLKYTQRAKLIFKKYFADVDPFTVFWHKLPIESFILINNLTSFTLKFSSLNTTNTSLIDLKDTNYYYLILFLNFSLDEVFFPLDGMVYTQNKVGVYNLVFTSLYYQHWLVINGIYKQNQLKSISQIYKSFTWVEREIQELSNVYFVGLIDNRRLLTDYTQYSYNFNAYKTNSYDLITQNLYY